MPADCGMDPGTYLEMHQYASPVLDMRASAAMTADPDCPKCNATGVYQHSDRRLALCDLCCKHNRGWWQLEGRSEEHTSELQSLMRISYAVFCLKKNTNIQ